MSEYVDYLLNSARGIYLPQDALEILRPEWFTDCDAEDLEAVRAGPDHEWYWEAWTAIEDAAKFTDSKGHKWHLFQSGDLFAVRDDAPPEVIEGLLG